MKNILNKWQLVWFFGRDYRTLERGWKVVRLGIINIHTKPEEGVILTKRYYKGFVIQFIIWLPIDKLY